MLLSFINYLKNASALLSFDRFLFVKKNIYIYIFNFFNMSNFYKSDNINVPNVKEEIS